MRSLVRPIVTVTVTLATVAFVGYTMVVQGQPIPQEWWLVLTGVISFWFAAREAEKDRTNGK